ncbi:MAG: phosphoribosyltransferase family protein [Mycobacterium sp.]
MAGGFLRRKQLNGFVDRTDAGHALAAALSERLPDVHGADVVVIGLARGGVPVAAVVAQELHAKLDVAVVRKLGVPGHEELALGAISRTRMILNHSLVTDLGITPDDIDAVAVRELRELERRENLYRQGRPPMEVTGHTVVLVDDGVATGASMHVAALAVRDAEPARLVVAVPTGPSIVTGLFPDCADHVVCVQTPDPFLAVGLSYRDFDQVDDAAVAAALGSV